MKPLAPGVYLAGVQDEELHIDLHELLRANGFPDTPAHREILVDEARKLLGGVCPVTIIEHDRCSRP